MADAIAAQADGAAPADTPAPTISPEIEAFIAQRVQALSDQRVAGLQSTFDRKLGEQGRELARLRRQLLPEDDSAGQEDDTEVARLQRENEALRAAQEFPDVWDAYQELVSASDARAQMEFLRSLKAPPAAPPTPSPATAATPEPEDDTPETDHNNPATNLTRNVHPTPDGGVEMSPDQARLVIEQAQRAWASGG